jgi:membrane protein required for colicin V production
MTALDYFVLIVVAASLIAGATKGILRGIVSVAFAVAGVIAAANLYAYAGGWFSWLTSSESTAQLISFLAIFGLTVATGVGAAFLLRTALKRVRLSWADHALGGAFGLVRGWLICSAIYLALTAIPTRPDAVRNAAFAPVLLEGTRAIAYLTSQQMRQRFVEGYNTVRGFWGQHE